MLKIRITYMRTYTYVCVSARTYVVRMHVRTFTHFRMYTRYFAQTLPRCKADQASNRCFSLTLAPPGAHQQMPLRPKPPSDAYVRTYVRNHVALTHARVTRKRFCTCIWQTASAGFVRRLLRSVRRQMCMCTRTNGTWKKAKENESDQPSKWHRPIHDQPAHWKPWFPLWNRGVALCQ